MMIKIIKKPEIWSGIFLFSAFSALSAETTLTTTTVETLVLPSVTMTQADPLLINTSDVILLNVIDVQKRIKEDVKKAVRDAREKEVLEGNNEIAQLMIGFGSEIGNTTANESFEKLFLEQFQCKLISDYLEKQKPAAAKDFTWTTYDIESTIDFYKSKSVEEWPDPKSTLPKNHRGPCGETYLSNTNYTDVKIALVPFINEMKREIVSQKADIRRLTFGR